MTTLDATALGALRRASELFRSAQRMLFITGAGLSAESGLPTYRGLGGLYEDRLTADGFSIEAVLSGLMLEQQPAVTWKYLVEIERACRGAGPNLAHVILAEFERRREHVVVLTQNVDGLHHRAGTQNLIEIHGRLHHLFCRDCDHRWDVPDYAGLSLPPVCPQCGGAVRPDVVLFGEMLPDAAVTRLEDELSRGFDLVVSIGTSSVFPYIAAPVEWARWARVPSIEINPGVTQVSSRVTVQLPFGAVASLSAIWNELYPDEALLVPPPRRAGNP
jgi:NAD-dependent deacetylase